MKLKELREKRASIIQKAEQSLRELNAKPADFPAEHRAKLEKDIDDALNEADRLKAEIESAERRERTDKALQDLDQPTRRRVVQVADDADEPRDAIIFRNPDTGERLRAFRPNESIADDFYRRHGGREHDRLSISQVCRALALGPKNEREVRALSEGTDSAGGYTVPTITSPEFIDRMRAQSVVIRAGALTVPLQTMTTKIARLATDPAVTWTSEAPSLAETSPTFEAVTFTARMASAGPVKCSIELLEDSLNLEDVLMQAFAKAMAAELDRVALVGSGTPPEPKGVVNVANVKAASNVGGPLANYSSLLSLYSAIISADAPRPTAAIMSPNALIQYAKLLDSTNQPMQRPELIRDLQFLDTTNVPVNLGSPVETEVILGYFPMMMIGVRSEISIQVLKERYADANQVAFIARMRADVQLMHPEAFGVLSRIGVV